MRHSMNSTEQHPSAPGKSNARRHRGGHARTRLWHNTIGVTVSDLQSLAECTGQGSLKGRPVSLVAACKPPASAGGWGPAVHLRWFDRAHTHKHVSAPEQARLPEVRGGLGQGGPR